MQKAKTDVRGGVDTGTICFFRDSTDFVCSFSLVENTVLFVHFIQKKSREGFLINSYLTKYRYFNTIGKESLKMKHYMYCICKSLFFLEYSFLCQGQANDTILC